jgi:hypothetical protein
MMSIIVYTCRTWEYAAHAQNRVLRAADNFDKRTQVREMNVAFKIPYVYHYVIKLCTK